MSAVFDDVTGHYVQLNLTGESVRLYFEESGNGIPLLCLHTAGADGRQYREIIRNSDVTDRFRVIIPDMPWHGRKWLTL